MEIDMDRADDALPALLYLTPDRDGRAWKGFAGDLISKARSVWLTEEGMAWSEQLFREMFCRPEKATAPLGNHLGI